MYISLKCVFFDKQHFYINLVQIYAMFLRLLFGKTNGNQRKDQQIISEYNAADALSITVKKR